MMLRASLSRIRVYVAGLAARIGRHLDDNAEKQKGKWGANMEYRRRYTNPDDAKRHRTPPAEKP